MIRHFGKFVPIFVLAIAFSQTTICPTAHAAIKKPVRTPQEFATLTTTENVRLASARIAMADYRLLAADFSQLSQGADEPESSWHARVDQWILDQTAYISLVNAQSTTVNTPIATRPDEKKTAYRPKGYGRAFVIPVEGGMIDVKGTGLMPGVVPTLAVQKRDGLATLGEMTREYLYEKLVEILFKKEGDQIDTVGSYAVIDVGFDVKHADGSSSRAAYILRQAHLRASGPNSSLPIEVGFKIEKLLRKYGITSSGESGNGQYIFNGYTAVLRAPGVKGEALDYINIQGTNNAARPEVIDFGAFIALEKFERVLRSPYDLNVVLLRPDTPEFVQPDAALRVPLEQWGDFGDHDPKRDKPFIWSHELASAYARGACDRSAFDKHYSALLDPVKARLGVAGVE